MAQTSTDKNSVKIKTKDAAGAWVWITGIAGKTLRQIFTDLQGKDAVCEYRRGDKVWFFCGTDALKKSMAKRGTAIMFAEGITLLDSVSPAWLDEVPVTQQMEEAMKRLGQNQPCLSEYKED